jgi:Fic family protein
MNETYMFRPRYNITNKILVNIGAVEAAKEVIEGAPLIPDWEAKFRQDALIRTVHFGTHVEGNDLTLNQAEKIVKEDPGRDETAEEVAKRTGIVARERDVQEVINYRNVIRFVDQLARLGKKTGTKFGEKEFVQIHSLTTEKLLPSHQLGVYRVLPVTVRGVADGEVVSRPPLPVEVPYQMEDFWNWLSSVDLNEIHPVIKAAVIHYELVRIHPFIEGNGRAARAFALLILAADGYNFKHFFSIEEYFDKNLAGYYKALASVEKNYGDMTEWISFFCEALAIELSKLKERVRRLSVDMALKSKLGGKQIALSERQVALMEALEMKEVLTMADARSVLPMVSDDTILRDLTSLVSKKLIRKRGKTKGARYILRK